ncbi:MAG: 23S rRNA (adenine(2503)-C(2))-methyltransferase RlmN [Candidatus Omnitrophica bacterium]|nr:23S rRNA (adenine(2503)-C(2))-methyltransferase RlmN [Candidatus Omnitrophota bacterium]
MAKSITRADIKDLLREELFQAINPLGVESFRVEQILEWIYKKGILDFDGMSNLSLKLRKGLNEKFYISNLEPVKQLTSKDGTKKFLFALEDSQRIESVFIPSKKTNTVCVSSQVGCKFSCKFCASGKAGFIRDLRPAEMVNQVLSLRGRFSSRYVKPHREPSPITNIVFMGMGEPFDNYENVVKAVRILNAPYGLGIGQRKITISTCGLIPEIKRFAEEKLQVELSISLHSANDKVRSSLMAINNKYPLKDLIEACKEYIKKRNRQVTFEYVLIKDKNSSEKDADALARLIKGMLVKVNLISFNPVEGLDYFAPEKYSVKKFKDILDRNGIISTIRCPRGTDIDAACGQLRLRNEKK